MQSSLLSISWAWSAFCKVNSLWFNKLKRCCWQVWCLPYGVNSTIASVDVCQLTKYYTEPFLFLKRCTIAFDDCIVGLTWKKKFFLRKQYTPPSFAVVSKYYSKAPFSATASTLFLFILQFLKSLPVLSPVIYNFSFSTYLSYIHFLSFVHMPPVLFHISHEENYLSFLFLPHFSYWGKEKRRPPPFHPNKSKPFDHVVLF